ncbi:hypothetical protein AX14_005678 [Amanita brunnescens Koide BX004]|nr:hypothetical protein AX14_005678 [Amanita brunnescens Koide BX004]
MGFTPPGLRLVSRFVSRMRILYAEGAYFLVNSIIQPSVSVLSIVNLSKYCSACASPASESKALRRCPNCKVVHYCDADCQTRDWSMHKYECTALQAWARAAPSAQVAIPSDAVRCLGRMLWRKRKSDTQGVIIDAMQSHRTSLQPSVYELHTHLAHALVRYLDLSSPEEMAGYGLTSIADLVDLISRFTTNAIGLATPSLTAIGTCVSPSLALLNHSCDPNAVIVFPRTSSDSKLQEPLLHVVAIKPIIAGEEILTSYIDATLPFEERQRTLKETYSFDCRCSLCDTKSVDPREVLLCPTRKNASSTICNGLCEIPKEAATRSGCNPEKVLKKQMISSSKIPNEPCTSLLI